MNNDIGNEQATSIELSWLAGIWDGEGSFVIYKQKKNHNKYALTTHITLTNTNIVLIEKVVEIMDKLIVGGHIFKEERKNLRLNHKDCYHITISGMIKQEKFVGKLLPYLVAKKPHAKLFKRYLDSRLKYRRDGKGNVRGCFRGLGYSNEEQSLYEQLRNLNKVGREPQRLHAKHSTE